MAEELCQFLLACAGVDQALRRGMTEVECRRIAAEKTAKQGRDATAGLHGRLNAERSVTRVLAPHSCQVIHRDEQCRPLALNATQQRLRG